MLTLHYKKSRITSLCPCNFTRIFVRNFPGSNKPPGHIVNIMKSLNKNKPTSFHDTVSKPLMGGNPMSPNNLESTKVSTGTVSKPEISQGLPAPHKPLKFDSIADKVESNLPREKLSDNFFNRLLDNNVLAYNNADTLKLTPMAQDIYVSQIKPKLTLVADAEIATETSVETFFSAEEVSIETSINDDFIVGTVPVHEDTEILSGVQQHLCIAKYNTEKDTVTIGVIFTSEKGTKAGIAGCTSTTKVADTKIFSSTNGSASGAQYARAIFPPIELPAEDFKENPLAAEFANDPDNKKILNDLYALSNKFKAETHDGKGITREDLEHIEDLMPQDVSDISIKSKNE